MADTKADVERTYKRMRHLLQYKDVSDSDLRRMAEQKVQDKVERLAPPKDPNDITHRFTKKHEQRLARELWDKYTTQYSLESVSELNTLRELIYLEIIQIRLYDKLNEMYDADSPSIPSNTLESVHDNSEAIVKLKTLLGLNKAKEELHGYDAFQHQAKRFQVWLAQNQASRTQKCPHCSKFMMLKMRTEAWEAQQHPFFMDNIIYNKHLFANLGKQVTIDETFIAKVLETSPAYINWVIQKRHPVTVGSSAAVPADVVM